MKFKHILKSLLFILLFQNQVFAENGVITVIGNLVSQTTKTIIPNEKTINQSSVYASTNYNLDFLVTEPNGKKVGRNSITKIIYAENQNSTYSQPEGIANNSNPDEPIPDMLMASDYDSLKAANGEYTFEIFNHKTLPTSYSFMVNHFDINGNVNAMFEYSGLLQSKKSVTYKTVHGTKPYVEEESKPQEKKEKEKDKKAK